MKRNGWGPAEAKIIYSLLHHETECVGAFVIFAAVLIDLTSVKPVNWPPKCIFDLNPTVLCKICRRDPLAPTASELPGIKTKRHGTGSCTIECRHHRVEEIASLQDCE